MNFRFACLPLLLLAASLAAQDMSENPVALPSVEAGPVRGPLTTMVLPPVILQPTPEPTWAFQKPDHPARHAPSASISPSASPIIIADQAAKKDPKTPAHKARKKRPKAPVKASVIATPAAK